VVDQNRFNASEGSRKKTVVPPHKEQSPEKYKKKGTNPKSRKLTHLKNLKNKTVSMKEKKEGKVSGSQGP